MRAELSELQIDIGILFPDHMLLFASDLSTTATARLG